MKERMLNNWTPLRVVYVVIGSLVMLQSGLMHEWVGLAFGGYFAAMGLFSFGCAAGACGYNPRQGMNAGKRADRKE